MARTLAAIVADGRDGFYAGEFGRALVDAGRGVFAARDLAGGFAEWCDPLRLQVWGHELWTVPPPSQGYLTLASAWIAEHAGLGADPSDPLWPHLVVEASRAAGHDRPSVLYDGADGRRSSTRSGSPTPRQRPSDRAAPPDVAPVVGAPVSAFPASATGTPPTCVPSTPTGSASR